MNIPAELLHFLIALVMLMAFVALNGMILVYLERKVAGHIQRRPGPYEVGPHGLLQPVADAVKLVTKQLACPKMSDRILYWVAPVLSFTPVFLLFLPIPFGPRLTGMELNLGLLLIVTFAGLNVLALCLAGWSSANKFSLLGAARAVSQNVAYEIPLLITVLTIAFQYGTLNLTTLVEQQGVWPWQWNFVFQPVAFVIYFICSVAETNRVPFDLAEAESELTAGFHTEYSGMGFGLFFLAEYAYMIIVSSVATVLFLGGWQGPGAPGVWWFLLKVYFLLLVIIWFRWTYPRVRFDQLLNLNWKWLLPLALFNLLVTLVVVKL